MQHWFLAINGVAAPGVYTTLAFAEAVVQHLSTTDADVVEIVECPFDDVVETPTQFGVSRTHRT